MGTRASYGHIFTSGDKSAQLSFSTSTKNHSAFVSYIIFTEQAHMWFILGVWQTQFSNQKPFQNSSNLLLEFLKNGEEILSWSTAVIGHFVPQLTSNLLLGFVCWCSFLPPYFPNLYYVDKSFLFWNGEEERLGWKI